MKKTMNIFLNIIILGLIVMIGYFGYQIYQEIKANSINNKIKESIEYNISIQEESSYSLGSYDESKFPTESINKIDKEENPTIFNPKDTEPSKFLYADFENLKENNKDTVAWIWIPDTKINYSVLQSKDNIYYLTHNFNKDKNKAGWIFGDYRSNFENLEKNTVIYGHNQLDASMFGDMQKFILLDDWFKNEEHKFIYLSTIKTSYVFKIISVYTTTPNPNYIQHGMTNNSEYQEFLDEITNKNEIKDLLSSANISDKILTLSTCTNHGQKRLVVHAKLIKFKNIQ